VNDGEVVLAVLDGEVQMRCRHDGQEHGTLLRARRASTGRTRILVVERKGSA